METYHPISYTLLHVALTGGIGETYNIGGHNEIQNIDVVKTICAVLDDLVPSKHDNIFNSFFKSCCESFIGYPVEFIFDFASINGVSNIMPRSIANKSD
jgi:hypothetical protein